MFTTLINTHSDELTDSLLGPFGTPVRVPPVRAVIARVAPFFTPPFWTA